MYKYIWGNNKKRETMKGRVCNVLARGKKNSILIEFIDNGQKEIVSRYSVRKGKEVNINLQIDLRDSLKK